MASTSRNSFFHLLVWQIKTMFHFLDIHTHLEKSLSSSWKYRTSQTIATLLNPSCCHMDRCNDRQSEFMYSVSTRFIYCHKEFLSSIEYGWFSSWANQFSLHACSSVCRSSLSVSELGIFTSISIDFCRERVNRSTWFFNPPETHRLTEGDIDDFVNCLKECAFISIFNKDHLELAAEACNYLSQLRPQLIIPPLIELFVLKFSPSNRIDINHFR